MAAAAAAVSEPAGGSKGLRSSTPLRALADRFGSVGERIGERFQKVVAQPLAPTYYRVIDLLAIPAETLKELVAGRDDGCK